MRSRYDGLARYYDFLERSSEKTDLGRWRKLLWSKVQGRRILEVGVGTGKNIPYYPPGAEVTAIDLSEKMLGKARRKAERLGHKIDFRVMDVQRLDLPDNSFDAAAATLVFCSVPDPLRGLNEIERVCRPGAPVLLLEHVRSDNPVIAFVLGGINPLAGWMLGDSVSRRTVEMVAQSRLVTERVTRLTSIFRLIEARKKPS